VSHPPAELEYVVRDSGASTVVVDNDRRDELAPIAAGAGARLVTVAEVLGRQPVDRLPHIGAPRRAMIIYTSGTTGRPKGVVSTHAVIGAQISSLVSAWGWRPTDRLLLCLPLHHVHGVINGLGSALAVRATCEILPAFDAAAVWDRLASGAITVFTAVPTIYTRLIAAWDAAPPATQAAWADGARRLRLMMSGSAALPVHVLERWRAIAGHTLLERYGMTEIGMALSNPLDGERRPGFVGTPLPGVEVRLVDDQGELADGGMPGELEVRGPAVFLEYWQRLDETRSAFRDGWFRTGDIGHLDNDGFLYITDRKKELFKTSGGKYIAPSPIEQLIRSSRFVSQAVLIGNGRKFPAALIVPNFEMLESYAHLKELDIDTPAGFCRHPRILDLISRQLAGITAGLSQYEKIKKFALLERELTVASGELTPTLKVRRRIVDERYRPLIDEIYGQAKSDRVGTMPSIDYEINI